MSRVDAAGRDVRADADRQAAAAIADQALLADVATGRVKDDANGTTWLHLGPGEEPADVSTRIWAWERADPPLVEQPEGSLRWRLTDAGRDAMRGRAS